MKTLRFKWDPAKAEMNVKQHGVSFEEAQTVFYDEFAVEFYDDEHEVINMKAEYDLSKMKSHRNPYAARLKRQVTLRLGIDVIEYFKTLSEETGIPYQSLISLYLQDCVTSHRTRRLT